MNQRILDGALGFFLASAIIMTWWLWFQSYAQTQYMFDQRFEGEVFQKELDVRIEQAVYRFYEVEKQKGKINEQ